MCSSLGSGLRGRSGRAVFVVVFVVVFFVGGLVASRGLLGGAQAAVALCLADREVTEDVFECLRVLVELEKDPPLVDDQLEDTRDLTSAALRIVSLLKPASVLGIGDQTGPLLRQLEGCGVAAATQAASLEELARPRPTTWRCTPTAPVETAP